VRELNASAKGRLDSVGVGEVVGLRKDRFTLPPRASRSLRSHFLSHALYREAVNSLSRNLRYSKPVVRYFFSWQGWAASPFPNLSYTWNPFHLAARRTWVLIPKKWRPNEDVTSSSKIDLLIPWSRRLFEKLPVSLWGNLWRFHIASVIRIFVWKSLSYPSRSHKFSVSCRFL